MKTVTKTMAIAILLVATFSCNKQNSDSTALNTANRSTAAASSRTIKDNDDLLGFGSPVGDWALYYDWGCSGEYGISIMTVNADSTFTNDQGSSGTWIEGKGIFMFNFNAPYRTTYSGTERISRVVGIMSAFGSPGAVLYPGCFYMVRAKSGSFKPSRVPGMPDVTGRIDTK